MTQSNPLFSPNLQLWVILCHIRLKRFEKVGKLKKLADVPPPKTKIFEISPKMRHLVAKDGKVVNQVKLTIQSQSQPHLGQNIEKHAK